MKLKVYYEGACHLCSREMDHFAHRPGFQDCVELVDISAPDFDAAAEGLAGAPLFTYMHVRRPDGQIRRGVDAFVELWRIVPGYRWLAWLAANPVLRPLFRLGYFLFAHVRRLLPKRKQVCALKPAQGGAAERAGSP
jgi:predicted DCC family thiol-disulfide oxidoreductase YuxK